MEVLVLALSAVLLVISGFIFYQNHRIRSYVRNRPDLKLDEFTQIIETYKEDNERLRKEMDELKEEVDSLRRLYFEEKKITQELREAMDKFQPGPAILTPTEIGKKVQRIKRIIKSGKLRKSLEELQEFAPQDFQADIIGLFGQLARAEEEEAEQISEPKDLMRVKNRISKAIISKLDEVAAELKQS